MLNYSGSMVGDVGSIFSYHIFINVIMVYLSFR